MLGRHHLALTLLTGAVALAPLFWVAPIAVLLAMAGLAVGALLPDVDADDAAIYHGHVRGLPGGLGTVVNATVAPAFPVVAYVTRYVIVAPTAWVYDAMLFSNRDVDVSHRGYTHSLLGIATTTLAAGAILAAIGGGLWALGSPSADPLAIAVAVSVTTAGLGAGQVLHTLQDSATVSGIAWLAPFSERTLRGRLRTSGDLLDALPAEGFTAVLLALAAVTAVGTLAEPWGLPPWWFAPVSTLAAALVWIAFSVGVARIEVT